MERAGKQGSRGTSVLGTRRPWSSESACTGRPAALPSAACLPLSPVGTAGAHDPSREELTTSTLGGFLTGNSQAAAARAALVPAFSHSAFPVGQASTERRFCGRTLEGALVRRGGAGCRREHLCAGLVSPESCIRASVWVCTYSRLSRGCPGPPSVPGEETVAGLSILLCIC